MDETKGPGQEIDDRQDAQEAKLRELDEAVRRLEESARLIREEVRLIRQDYPPKHRNFDT